MRSQHHDNRLYIPRSLIGTLTIAEVVTNDYDKYLVYKSGLHVLAMFYNKICLRVHVYSYKIWPNCNELCELSKHTLPAIETCAVDITKEKQGHIYAYHITHSVEDGKHSS